MTETARPRPTRAERADRRRAETAVRQARKARAQAARRTLQDFRPPEGVVLNFQIASIGARLGAQLLDLLLTGLAVIAVIILLLVTEIAPWSAISTLAALMFFCIRAPYYVVTELLWNGQTLGKRITGLRVISADGRSLRPYAVTVRNLMKELEVFVPAGMLLAGERLSAFEVILLLVWIVVLLIVPFTNRRRQRLGDIVAGTYVIHQPRAVLLPDVARQADQAETERFRFLNHQLDHYGRFELQTLERVLQADEGRFGREMTQRNRENMATIAEKIAAKIEYTGPLTRDDHKPFLQAFYRAQRQYLETRQLFGDAREDKFHKDDDRDTKDNQPPRR